MSDASNASTRVALGAVAKYGAEAVALACSLLTGAMTARNLGPAGKGDLASITYLAMVFASAATLGLGDVGVLAASAPGARLSTVAARTTAVLVRSSAIGVALFSLGAMALFGAELGVVGWTIALSAGTIPTVGAIGVLVPLLDHGRRYEATAASRVVGAVVTALLTFLLVTLARRGLSAAALANLAGWVASALVAMLALRRVAGLARPAFDRTFARTALRFGVPVQFSQLLMVATTRADVLVAHAVAGRDVAGIYSVATTLGAINTMAAIALAGAAFPHVASLPESDVASYVARLARSVALIAVAIAVVIGVTLPVVVPLAFGTGFRDAVAPASILLVGGVAWSVQYVLCRAMAASGRTDALTASFGGSLVVMLAGDAVLIPALGAVGAAIASTISSVVGMLLIARSWSHRGLKLSAIVPRRADAADLVATLLRSTLRLARFRRRDGAPDDA